MHWWLIECTHIDHIFQVKQASMDTPRIKCFFMPFSQMISLYTAHAQYAVQVNKHTSSLSCPNVHQFLRDVSTDRQLHIQKGGTGLQDSPCLHHPTSTTVKITTPHFFPHGQVTQGRLLLDVLAHKTRHNCPVTMNHKNLTVVFVL